MTPDERLVAAASGEGTRLRGAAPCAEVRGWVAGPVGDCEEVRVARRRLARLRLRVW